MRRTVTSIAVEGEILATTITRPPNKPEAKPTILFIHGAGGGNRARLQYLADALSAHGHTTLSFDHSGHGDSTGKLENSSLARKLVEARAMLAHMAPGPITVIGSSMGAHVATQLTAHTQVKTLILMVPAAYTPAAENVNFGPDFKTTISQPESWQHSTNWQHIQAFIGNLVLVSTGLDEIIPPGVLRNYWSRAINATTRTHLRYPQVPHAFQNWVNKTPTALPPLLQTLIPLL